MRHQREMEIGGLGADAPHLQQPRVARSSDFLFKILQFRFLLEVSDF